MRSLTPQQKRALKEWFDKNYDGGYKFGLADRIPYMLYTEIENMHPTEIHYQNVNHFLEDLVDKRAT